jgi:dihydrofolate reductase
LVASLDRREELVDGVLPYRSIIIAMPRELFVFNMVTLDGFFAGPNGEIDWHNTDDEFGAFANSQMSEIGGLVFGRRTYELMAGYWPTADAVRDEPVVAAAMNDLPKLVFSRSLQRVDWSNSRIAKGVEDLTALKGQPGRDLAVFGSADLLETLIPLGVVDEYRLMITPLVLGEGKPLFKDARQRLDLEFTQSRTFRNGNVLLSYRPRRASKAT